MRFSFIPDRRDFLAPGVTLAAAEHVRDLAAGALGCSTEEIVITRSTTDGMNAIAQGLRLTAGQRILTSDQEHEGGESCWDCVAGRHELHIDVVKIPPTEHNPAAIEQHNLALRHGDGDVRPSGGEGQYRVQIDDG